MEIINKYSCLPIYLLLVSCAPIHQSSENQISDVYVADFKTENMAECKPADVDLNNSEAAAVFVRSKIVDYKIVHDHYNVAPCHIEGVLTLGEQICEWKIQASAIGSVTCKGTVNYYVCDSCEDFFN